MKDQELALYRAGLAWALQYVGKVQTDGSLPLFLNGVPAETDLRVMAAFPMLWPNPPIQKPMDLDALFKLCEAVAPIEKRGESA